MRDHHVDGAELRRCRLAALISQRDLAKRLKITPQHLCKVEADTAECSDLLARRLAAELGVPVEQFTRPGRRPAPTDTQPNGGSEAA